MEETRLDQLKHLGEQYHRAMAEHRPKLVASAERLREPIMTCNVQSDLDTVKKKKV